MATAADSSSPYSSRFRRGGHNLSSPWSHVVRGEHEAGLVPAAPSPPSSPFPTAGDPSDRSPVKAAYPADVAAADAARSPPPTSDGEDQGGSGDAFTLAPEKRSAWSRPSNGVIEAGAVMGAASWPALSEAAKAPLKSSSYDAAKGLSNGSVPATPAPVTTSPPPKSAPSNTNYSSATNHASPIRQKSLKRGGGRVADDTIANNGGGAFVNGGPMLPQMHATSAELSSEVLDKSVKSEPSPRGLANRSNNWDHGSRVGGLSGQSHGGSEHQKGYGGGRRGNNSGGGGGHHHNNFGNRPDLERGSYDWNRRSFSGGRDVQVQQQQQQQQPRAMARPFLRHPPPGSAPFVAPPPPLRPFGNPMGYPDIPSTLFYVPTPPPPESFRGMPFVAPPAMFYTSPELQFRAMLLKQIDYYFSSENLCKDVFLRQKMDEEGWVPVSLIAGFNRVKNLTNNIQFILDTVRTSAIIEVQGEKIRRRNDWKNWLLLNSAPNPLNSSTLPNNDALAAGLTQIRMEDGSTGQNSMGGMAHTGVVLSRSSSGDFNSQSQIVTSMADRSAQNTIQNDSDRSAYTRSLSRSDTF